MTGSLLRYTSVLSTARHGIVRLFTRTISAALPVVLCLLAATPATAVSPQQGDRIINIVTISAANTDTPTVSSISTVTTVMRTPSTIEYLHYAPTVASATPVPVVTGSYRSGASSSVPFTALPAPTMAGATSAIGLGSPIPLAPVSQIHQGDPLFIRTTDLDQNLDRLARETIFVTITNPNSGDSEVVLLTETGVDTGIFTGYIPTSAATATAYNGSLSVSSGDTLSTRYVDIVDGSDTSATAILVDPNGIAFDSSTGAAINGMTITMINTATGLPATVYGDDGVSSYPATLTTGGTATDSSGTTYSFPAGGYRFPFVSPGSYRYLLTAPFGYTAPSTLPASAFKSLSGMSFAVVDGSHGDLFTVNPGPALKIDIPLDPIATSLWLQKSAGKDTVGQGDFVPYQLTVANTSALIPAPGVKIIDTLPAGVRLRKGSVRIDGAQAADPGISADGRTLTFTIGTLAADASSAVQYVAEVTAGAKTGPATNRAVATSSTGGSSQTAQATVQVRDDFLRTNSTLMGRVTTGACSDVTGDGPDGVEGVKIYLEDGTFVVSDKRGLFHFEGVRPGLHVVQMDLDSLPEGFEASPCTENSRFAGRAFSQFVETQGGTLWRADFHLKGPAKPAPHIEPEKAAAPAPAPATQQVPAKTPAPAIAPVKGEVVIELSNQLEKNAILYKVAMRASAQPVQQTRANVMLPAGVEYVPGSSRMDGAAIADPIRHGAAMLEYRLGELPAGWKHDITFKGRPTGNGKAATLAALAYLAVDGKDGSRVLTPPAEASIIRDSSVKTVKLPSVTLRPHFPTFGAELDAEDRERLDELARLLTGLNADRIHVVGHTDTVRIAPRSRGVYKDNFALSMARAKSVGRYLMEKLHLPPERLTYDGKGPTEPVASNRTAEEKALNRRVEVQTSTSRSTDTSRMSVLKEFSGEQRAETAPAAVAAVATGTEQIPAAPTAAAPMTTSTGKIPFTTAVLSAPLAPSTAATATATATATADTAAPAAAKAPAKTAGILNIANGDLLTNRIAMVQGSIDSGLTPKLLVDGKEVGKDQIGMRSQDSATGKTGYSYLGVDLGEEGEHTLTLQGVDPFGNARFNETVTLKRSGEVATIRVAAHDGNVADGKTPVRLRLELRDISGNIINAAAELELRDGSLKPRSAGDASLEEKAAGRRILMNRDGWVEFEPVTQSGPYRFTIARDKALVEGETYVQPKLRDWILVGLAEGSAGYNTVSGNMESLSSAGVSEQLYQDGRVALYAKGQIQGKWLMTTAYDSAKTKDNSGNSLFQTINPETYYTLYGDATQQQYDAASAKKLYVKIEREQFYAMFGDYDTGLTVTELSRYSRRMTGVKSELQAEHFEASVFASETDQAYVRDELPGDGTSGIYHLSRKKIVPNTEKITIKVRDRYRSEIVISSKTLGRFTEYSIDYDTGGVFFKEPVYSRDGNFNPVTIVAEYEAVSTGGVDYNYGGRAGVKLLDQKLKLGGSYIHEGQGVRIGNLYGVDSSLKIGTGTKLRAEFATSDYSAGTASKNGNAWLAEAVHNSKLFDVKTYYREQGTGFGLGQQSGGESGTRKFGAEGTYRFNQQFSSNANAYRQYNLLAGATRDVAEGKVSYNDPHSGLSLGVLHANDRLGNGSRQQSTQLTAGGKVVTLYDRLTLTVDHAQSVGGNSNSDFPTRTSLGAELKVTRNLTLLAAQEFTWGKTADTQNTRVGLRATPWKGATLTSSVERQLGESEERVFANVGLKQTWQINDAWKADAGVDRSQTLARSSRYQFNTNVPPASGGNENFTAISTGATYQVKHLTWDNRVEGRIAESQDKWGLLSGIVNEVDGRWAWSGRVQVYQTFAATGIDTTQANLRYGLVFRPPRTKWILLNRLDYFIDTQSGTAAADTTSWRLVNNLNANYRPYKQLQISLQYGAKFVKDTIGGSSYSGFTDHIGVEARYDITKKWDIGLRGSVLHSWHGGQFAYSFGPSTGYNIVENAWISLGYNVAGFEDKDFASAAYTAQGPYVRFRMKFDQQSVKDAAGWLNKE